MSAFLAINKFAATGESSGKSFCFLLIQQAITLIAAVKHDISMQHEAKLQTDMQHE